jgi:hypothetical protein
MARTRRALVVPYYNTFCTYMLEVVHTNHTGGTTTGMVPPYSSIRMKMAYILLLQLLLHSMVTNQIGVYVTACVTHYGPACELMVKSIWHK